MAEVRRKDDIQGEIVHEYDGIEEADNQLPRWWLWTLYGSIAFAIGYWFAYHELEAGRLPGERYADALAAQAERGGGIDEAALLAMVDDPEAVDAGRQAFATNCVACHGAQGEGKIGPNLTDHHWINGGAPLDIYQVIRQGVPAKGMPAWGQTLGPAAVEQLAAFVLSVRGQEVPGKVPEGEPYTPGGGGEGAAGASEPDAPAAAL